MIYLLSGEVPKRYGSAHPSIVPYQAFKCRDGKYIIVAVGNDRQWIRLCKVLGREDLINDERFKTNQDRVRNRDKLIPIVEEVFLQKKRIEWMRTLEEADVPYGPVYDLSEVFEDEYVKYSRIVFELAHETLGSIKQLAYPASIDGDRPRPKSPPPKLGNEAVNILREAGYDNEEIERLINNKIICCEE
jgi:formyl-CoA transferase